MHLHGHDFRLINSKGEYSPLEKCGRYYADGNQYD
jgi:hypothetical protein